MNSFFFDTYALHQIAEGSSSYLKYSGNVGVVTTKLNLMELYYAYLIKNKKLMAESLFERFSNLCVEVTDEVIKEAMQKRAELKRLRKGSNISYVDCIGYALALRLKIPFLTGDREFERLENVEFVK